MPPAAMPTYRNPCRHLGQSTTVATVCNGVSQGKPVVLVDGIGQAFETSAKPAIVKNCLRSTKHQTSLSAVIFHIFFAMLISFSG